MLLRQWIYLHIAGQVLYTCFGIFHCIVTQRNEYIPYYLITSSSLVLLGYLYKKSVKFKVEVPARVFNLTTFIVILNSLYISIQGGFTVSDWICILILIFGTIQFSWLMPRRYFALLFTIAMVFLLMMMVSPIFETQLSKLLYIPVFCFVTWQAINTKFQNDALKAQVEFEKLTAFKATVTGLNHNFNNLSGIILTCINRRKKSNDLDEVESVLHTNLKKLLKLINKVSNLTDYKEETYIGDSKMVSLEEK